VPADARVRTASASSLEGLRRANGRTRAATAELDRSFPSVRLPPAVGCIVQSSWTRQIGRGTAQAKVPGFTPTHRHMHTHGANSVLERMSWPCPQNMCRMEDQTDGHGGDRPKQTQESGGDDTMSSRRFDRQTRQCATLVTFGPRRAVPSLDGRPVATTTGATAYSSAGLNVGRRLDCPGHALALYLHLG